MSPRRSRHLVVRCNKLARGGSTVDAFSLGLIQILCALAQRISYLRPVAVAASRQNSLLHHQLRTILYYIGIPFHSTYPCQLCLQLIITSPIPNYRQCHALSTSMPSAEGVPSWHFLHMKAHFTKSNLFFKWMFKRCSYSHGSYVFRKPQTTIKPLSQVLEGSSRSTSIKL